MKIDAKEALQYVYCGCLAADQGDGVGKEQIENAWELVRRIIVLGNSGPGWEELVGGFRPDGSRFVSFLHLPISASTAFHICIERRYRTRGDIITTQRQQTIQ